jgi:hypothetical protein
MTELNQINLDTIAAKRAQKIVSKARSTRAKKPYETMDRLVTKALGVLQEQGIYALMLFLFSRSSEEEKVAPVIRKQLYKALEEIPEFEENENLERVKSIDKPQKMLAFYTQSVLDDLDKTLLVRDVYEQTLIYTRYGAKAEKKEG